MAIYGALGENPSTQGSRRGEMVDRGTLVIPTSAAGVGTVTVPAPMRVMTHFLLTVDDLGVAADGVTATKPAVVTGSLNASGTTLTINLYVATSAGNPTLIQTGVGGSVRYAIWGTL